MSVKIKSENEGCFASIARNSEGFGVWLLSVVFAIGVPSLPIMIIWIRNHTSTESGVQFPDLLATTVILSCGFVASSNHKFMKGVYGLITFVGAALYSCDLVPEKAAVWYSFAAWIFFVSIGLHAVERLWWHTYLKLPFPRSES